MPLLQNGLCCHRQAQMIMFQSAQQGRYFLNWQIGLSFPFRYKVMMVWLHFNSVIYMWKLGESCLTHLFVIISLQTWQVAGPEPAISSDQLLVIHTGCGTYAHLPQDPLVESQTLFLVEIHEQADMQVSTSLNDQGRFCDQYSVLLTKLPELARSNRIL